MTGKIEVQVRIGQSKDTRYDSYPEWYMKVTGECGKSVILSPNWPQLQDFIKDVKIHEMRVDLTRELRENDADNWEESIKQAAEEAQRQIKDFEIPEIYYVPKLKENHSPN